jgi:hypothetical protein
MTIEKTPHEDCPFCEGSGKVGSHHSGGGFSLRDCGMCGGKGTVAPANPPLDARPKLRDPLEIINSSSRVQLKADPVPDMARIAHIAQVCCRHHPTLALSTWKSNIGQIRAALENIEDIYDSTRERIDR